MTAQQFAPEAVHQRLMANAFPELTFRPGVDVTGWRAQLLHRLRDVVGLEPDRCELDVRVEWTARRDTYLETRFVFTSEPGADVPCHLLVPDADAPRPVVVCLQGHSPGMHVSLKRAEPRSLEPGPARGDRDFALQAVASGYAALVIEQRCFGERVDARPAELRENRMGGCHHATHAAMLLGRTMVGERVWDVSRALDAVADFDGVDMSRVACMGNSGGGTISWYAACLDNRIGAIMPSCSICTYAASIGTVNHCSDNYLPGALRYFDMPDLAGLLAPRPLVVVAGEDDPLFPVKAVHAAFERIREIYDAFGAESKCELVIGAGGHRFYADDAWPVFNGLTGWPS